MSGVSLARGARDVFAVTVEDSRQTEQIDDAGLVRRAAEDKNALKELYIKYRADVYAFSLSMYNDRTIAEDCVQETFIRLPSASVHFKKGHSEAAFILGIAKNVSRELYRSELRFRKMAQSGIPDGEGGQLDGGSGEILRAVGALPRKNRIVIMLRIYSGMSFKETAGLLRLPESTVKSRYRRALRLLMNELRKNNITDITDICGKENAE